MQGQALGAMDHFQRLTFCVNRLAAAGLLLRGKIGGGFRTTGAGLLPQALGEGFVAFGLLRLSLLDGGQAIRRQGFQPRFHFAGLHSVDLPGKGMNIPGAIHDDVGAALPLRQHITGPLQSGAE